MRLVLAVLIATLGATAASAQAAGDRYGYGPRPRSAAQAAPQSLETQGLRPLTWTNKTALQPVQAAAPAPARPQALALAGQYSSVAPDNASRDLPPPSAPRWRPSAYQPFTPQAPYQAPQQLAALTAPPPQALPPRALAPVSPPPRAVAAPPPQLAGGPPAAPQQVAQAAPRTGEGVRYYSIHRGYGLTPDAIPEPPHDRGYVLIGPSDTATAPKDRPGHGDDNDDDDKSDRPF